MKTFPLTAWCLLLWLLLSPTGFVGASYTLPNGGLSSNSGSADSDDLYDLTGKTLKRLGDSLYEQRLVQEQILNLTGRTNLGNYADSQAQFAALVANGTKIKGTLPFSR